MTDPFYERSGNFTVNIQDNIGDFSSNNILSDPNQKEEDKQTYNRLSQISDDNEDTSSFFEADYSPLFYDENTSNVIQPIAEEEKQVDEDQPEYLPDETTPLIEQEEEMPFIEQQEEIINDKPEFVAPERQLGEDGRTYKGRVEYERKKFYGETIRADQRRRYEPKSELFEKK